MGNQWFSKWLRFLPDQDCGHFGGPFEKQWESKCQMDSKRTWDVDLKWKTAFERTKCTFFTFPMNVTCTHVDALCLNSTVPALETPQNQQSRANLQKFRATSG